MYLGFHPLYRGTWYLTTTTTVRTASPSGGFHPLYRGTWYLTILYGRTTAEPLYVSIRYIAVLGI